MTVRCALRLTGTVQGVGFRPFVYRIACEHGVTGFVANGAGSLLAELEGAPDAVERCIRRIRDEAPPLSVIESCAVEALSPQGSRTFEIAASRGDQSEVWVPPDAATCSDCLRELFDVSDRRHHYPFLNCTNCGPRFSIVLGVPYDRVRTTMRAFPLCAACAAEYRDPLNRRFHAEPIACVECGPRLEMRSSDGPNRRHGAARDVLGPHEDQVIAEVVRRLTQGQVAAIKGLGGYHLACLARHGEAVARLRQGKLRGTKPFALMVRDLDQARRLARVDPVEAELLQQPSAPIVLVRRRTDAAVCDQVAPNNAWLGIMLPYTPLHHLLLHGVGEPLLMTSGNASDEPMAYEERHAEQQLGGMVDVLLHHDRSIARRCDDSIYRVIGGAPTPLRVARGIAPARVPLPYPLARPTLAVGAHMKSTVALGQGRQALLSHHLGDLVHYAAYQAFEAAIDDLECFFDIRPLRVVCDLHPDYASTAYARERARRAGIDLVRVQHHHAHLASCLAEHAVAGPCLGVCFDGTGYGPDGTIWGGEFLVGDAARVERLARFRPLPLKGGEASIRQPWRMAQTCLIDAAVDPDAWLEGRVSSQLARRVAALSAQACPSTSSVGRLFDAVGVLCGAPPRASFDAEAALFVESLATEHEGAVPPYPYRIEPTLDPAEIDLRPCFVELASELRHGGAAKRVARRFIVTLAEASAEMCRLVAEGRALDCVALSGGVFANALLTTELARRLLDGGFRVYRHQRVPPNDGGISLGQLAVVAAQDGAQQAR